jgi:hypothetical protein
VSMHDRLTILQGVRSAAALSILSIAVGPTGGIAAQVQSVAPNAEVTTVAGDGLAGLEDGRNGRFLFPTGLARAKDGTIYVADAAGQRLKTIDRDGIVRTVAGGGALGPMGLSVPGGFADGPALTARFNYPSALAISPVSGAVYIADSANACIRMLFKGAVTTLAGKAGERTAVDGPPERSRLVDPSGLAFDSHGNLYITDFGVGLRRLNTDGTLQTLPLKSNGDVRMLGISAAPAPAGTPTMFITTPETLFVYDVDRGTDVAYGLNGNFLLEGNLLGKFNQLAALDDHQFLYTDLMSPGIKYFRMSEPPFVSTLFARQVGGDASEDAGYKDGPRQVARFSLPAGLVLDGKSVIVADAGNRRIRRLLLPALRRSETGLSDPALYDAAHYQIVYIGQSAVFWNSLGDDSFCAILERRLDESGRLRKPARCHTIRIDAATLAGIGDYLNNYVLDRHVDLLVLGMNASLVNSLDQTATSLIADLPKLRGFLQPLAQRLQSERGQLALCWYYFASDFSNAESSDTSITMKRSLTLPDEGGGGDLRRSRDQIHERLVPALNDLPLLQYDSLSTFVDHEKAADPAPVYVAQDPSHMSPAGTATLAGGFATFMVAHLK